MNVIQKRVTINRVEDVVAVQKLYEELFMLEEEYPQFRKWFFEKVIPEIKTNSRKVFTAYIDEALAGILIIKDAEEKKICTLRVLPEFRRIGVGHQLMNCAIRELCVKRPLITVSDAHFEEFKGLLSEYGFVVKELHYGLYETGHVEFVYNGSLNDN